MKKLFRAEQGFINCYTANGKKISFTGSDLISLQSWAKDNCVDQVILNHKAEDVLCDSDKSSIKRTLGECITQHSPSCSLSMPEQLQVELTTKCSLRCSQCFCNLEGQDIDKEKLFSYLYQAAWFGIPYISLSGGEPLLYPWLNDTINLISKLGLYSALATSGVGLTLKVLRGLKSDGLNELFFSLNGSTKAIHNLSRDAFDETIAAMTLSKKENVPYRINWVAREDNVHDFEAIVKIAKQLNASGVSILALKPDQNNVLISSLSSSSLKLLANKFKNHNQNDISVSIEGCYPSLLMEVFDNINPCKIGCEAGRKVISINVDGSLSPCRHVPLIEKYQSLKKYWYKSKELESIRKSYKGISDGCMLCS